MIYSNLLGPVRSCPASGNSDVVLCPRDFHQQHRLHHHQRLAWREGLHLQRPSRSYRIREATCQKKLWENEKLLCGYWLSGYWYTSCVNWDTLFVFVFVLVQRHSAIAPPRGYDCLSWLMVMVASCQLISWSVLSSNHSLLSTLPTLMLR